MFSAGIGQMDSRHTKNPNRKGHARGQGRRSGVPHRHGRRRGVLHDPGENIAELDFNAVQRGDAEMEQKMNR